MLRKKLLCADEQLIIIRKKDPFAVLSPYRKRIIFIKFQIILTKPIDKVGIMCYTMSVLRKKRLEKEINHDL